MRRSLTSFAATALALTAAAPASAGTLSVQNSCLINLDQVWHHMTVDLGGVATPNPAAPGSGVQLGQTSVRARIPDYLVRAGHGIGVLKAGANTVRAKAWLAVEGTGSAQGVVVHALEATATTTITEDAAGEYVSSTPLDVTIPVPDTTWTAGTTALSFRQAGGKTLPPVPAGTGGATVQPLGSALIRAEIGSLAMLLDCQPATGEGKTQPPPQVAGAFETVAVDPSATATPAPKDKPVVALRSTKLKAAGRKVKVSLACTAANCAGAVTLKAGSKTLAPKTKYSVRSGTRKTITLTLSKAARRSLKDKKTLKVSLRVTATGGKTITKKLTLR